MKLFTKISLISAAIAGGIGILAIVIGLALGADVTQLNDMGIYISPYQQETVSQVMLIKQHHNETGHNNHPNEIDATHHNENLHNYTCKLRGIKRLEVEVQNAQITIFATESMNDFTYYSNRATSIVKEEGTTLKLEDHADLKDKIELELYIPIGMLKEIEIEAVNATIWADKMVADNIKIEIDNAAVQIDELVVEDKAELQINAGQMVIGYYDGKQLETECAMGSIMVVCEGKQNDYNYDLECGMGQIQIQNDSYSGMGKDIQIHNDSSKYIIAECALGEIILEFPNHM